MVSSRCRMGRYSSVEKGVPLRKSGWHSGWPDAGGRPPVIITSYAPCPGLRPCPPPPRPPTPPPPARFLSPARGPRPPTPAPSLRRQVGCPRWRTGDRLPLAALSQRLSAAAWPAFLVRPETLLRWHRELVRRKWAVFAARRRELGSAEVVGRAPGARGPPGPREPAVGLPPD